MIDPVLKYGRQEAKEHKVSLKIGKKLASDHIKEFGVQYYQKLAELERKLKKR